LCEDKESEREKEGGREVKRSTMEKRRKRGKCERTGINI